MLNNDVTIASQLILSWRWNPPRNRTRVSSRTPIWPTRLERSQISRACWIKVISDVMGSYYARRTSEGRLKSEDITSTWTKCIGCSRQQSRLPPFGAHYFVQQPYDDVADVPWKWFYPCGQYCYWINSTNSQSFDEWTGIDREDLFRSFRITIQNLNY